jgi:Ca2+-binding RTX toxin-like protein
MGAPPKGEGAQKMANIGGTTGDDLINGTSLADRINGGAGDDEIYGGGGADLLYGGIGNDFIDGGSGADYIVGGAGDDNLLGREGVDVFAFWFRVLGDNGSGTAPEGPLGSSVATLLGGEGYDAILDFDNRSGGDKLDFNGMKAGQFDHLVATGQLSFSHADYTGDGNTDMRIAWDGGAIVLGGVTASEIADLVALKSYMMFDA